MTRVSLYLTAQGGYVSGATGLANEIWQTGIRLQLSLDPAPPAIGTIPNNEYSIVPANINRTETNWTIVGNWLAEGGVNDFDPGDYLNDLAGPAFRAWIATTGAFAGAVELRTLRLYPIGDPDGHVIPAPPYAQGTPCLLTYTGTRPHGVVSGAMLPPNNSVVASLRTSQIGRRGRGRMFSPACGVSVIGQNADAGVVTSANRTILANAYVTLLEALHYNEAVKVRPIVIGAPYADYAVINQVRVGNVVDGQRRRRNALLETYTSAPVDVL